MKQIDTDVLVIGSGIAGCMAAIKASEQGSKVCLVSSGATFSGSSFYPGTWGFGLIGPENKEDEENLIKTILKVGMGMADEEVVKNFVRNITESINQLKDYGVPLKKPEQTGDKEFIPCFDYKTRSWNGLEQKGAKEALRNQLDKHEVISLPSTTIIKCFQDEEGRVIGALGVQSKEGLISIGCRSIVMASGGLGGLFKYRLNTKDIRGMGHYLALELGASLTNIEFMQMMPGYISPHPKTIFNEKTFKYCQFLEQDGEKSIFDKSVEIDYKRALEERSTHGPFTSRLYSKYVDFAIFKYCLQYEQGVTVRYKEALKNQQPEFIKIYFDWLKKEKNLTIEDEIQLGIFYHAANGGIKINQYGETGVLGLYACGECTGGMHGADRIGGLSTANGLVFGSIAGENAGRYAKTVKKEELKDREVSLVYIKDAKKFLKQIQQINFECAMIFRSEKKAKNGLNSIQAIEESLQRNRLSIEEAEGKKDEIIESTQLLAAITISKGLLEAIRLRKESRGSHYRIDYSELNTQYNKKIRLHKEAVQWLD